MQNFLKKTIHIFLVIAIFLLPLQTRYIWNTGYLNGGIWEYGTFSIYSIDILMLFIFIFAIIEFYKDNKIDFVKIKNVIFKNKKKEEDIFEVQDFVKNKENNLINIKYEKLILSWLFIFICFSGLSILWSQDKFVALFVWFRLIEAIAFGVIVFKFFSYRFLWSFILSAFVQAIWGIVQFFYQWQFANKWLGVSKIDPTQLGVSVIEYFSYVPSLGEVFDYRILRAYGGLPHPNIFGGFLCIALLVGIYMYLKIEYSFKKLFLMFVNIILFLGMLFSFSRSAWLTFLVGLILFGIYIFKITKQTNLVVDSCELSFYKNLKFDFIKLSVVFCIFLSAVVLIMPNIFMTRLGFGVLNSNNSLLINQIQNNNIKNNELRLEKKSINERIGGYEDVLKIISTNSNKLQFFLFGGGIGNYTVLLSLVYPNKIYYELQPVHNVFLLIFIELGLFGIFILSILFCVVIKIFKKFNLIEITDNRFFLILIISILVLGLFDHWLWSLPFGLMLSGFLFGVIWNFSKN